jgi:hypothetical protein
LPSGERNPLGLVTCDACFKLEDRGAFLYVRTLGVGKYFDRRHDPGVGGLNQNLREAIQLVAQCHDRFVG